MNDVTRTAIDLVNALHKNLSLEVIVHVYLEKQKETEINEREGERARETGKERESCWQTIYNYVN